MFLSVIERFRRIYVAATTMRMRAIRQELSAQVVVPEGPRRVTCVELVLTFFANGDWEVVGPTPGLHARGGEDTFERSMARLVLGIGSAAITGAA